MEIAALFRNAKSPNMRGFTGTPLYAVRFLFYGDDWRSSPTTATSGALRWVGRSPRNISGLMFICGNRAQTTGASHHTFRAADPSLFPISQSPERPTFFHTAGTESKGPMDERQTDRIQTNPLSIEDCSQTRTVEAEDCRITDVLCARCAGG